MVIESCITEILYYTNACALFVNTNVDSFYMLHVILLLNKCVIINHTNILFRSKKYEIIHAIMAGARAHPCCRGQGAELAPRRLGWVPELANEEGTMSI